MTNQLRAEDLEQIGLSPDEAAYTARQHELAAEIGAADPSLGITALIIGGDRASAERAWREAEAGRWDASAAEAGERPFEYASMFVGSYARLDFIVRAYEAGHISREWLHANFAEEWRGSDPVDTEPRFLAVWREVWEANGRQTILDPDEGEAPRPLPDGDPIRVYRGQDQGTAPGIAWTTDLAIAEKFARGAALRQGHRAGNVLVATVPRNRVIAYLTGRGESEVILDPADLKYVEAPLDGAVQR